jgi:hypothetical protein
MMAEGLGPWGHSLNGATEIYRGIHTDRSHIASSIQVKSPIIVDAPVKKDMGSQAMSSLIIHNWSVIKTIALHENRSSSEIALAMSTPDSEVSQKTIAETINRLEQAKVCRSGAKIQLTEKAKDLLPQSLKLQVDK